MTLEKAARLLARGTRKFYELFKGSSDKAMVFVVGLLVAVNISIAVTTSFVMSPVAIVTSNIVTVLLSLLLVKPVGNILRHTEEKELDSKVRQRIEEKEKDALVERLGRQVDDLLGRIRALEQSAAAPSYCKTVARLERFHIEKDGYRVNEYSWNDFLQTTGTEWEETETMLPWKSNPSDEWRVLTAWRFRYKASVGIDLGEIRIAQQDNKILLSGLHFSRFHETAALSHEGGDIEVCEIVNHKKERIEIKSNSKFDEKRGLFVSRKLDELKSQEDALLDQECAASTARLKSLIEQQLGGRLALVDSEPEGVRFIPLQETNSIDEVNDIIGGVLTMDGGHLRLGEGRKDD